MLPDPESLHLHDFGSLTKFGMVALAKVMDIT
jgi:hypothetical protein